MKIKRTKEDFGGGIGGAVYESDVFRVVNWKHHRRERTTIERKLVEFSDDIAFNGHHAFDSDELCMEQLECKEILEMIVVQKIESFQEGEESKIRELKKCLAL